MQSGTTTREYTTNKTHYVVEGYSNKTKQHVYPSEGWSYTSWENYISTTYDTMKKALNSFKGGYLKDMIEQQDVVDITVYEITTVTKCEEIRKVVSYTGEGEPINHVEPVFTTDLGELGFGDYVVIDNIYCQVESFHDNRIYLDVISGGWQLVLYIQGSGLYVDPKSQSENYDEEVFIKHIGAPDPTQYVDDYNYQLEYYREHFDGKAEVTSTKLTVVPNG